ALLVDIGHKPDGVGELAIAEGQHDALGTRINAGDVRPAAKKLDRYNLQEVIHFNRQWPEAVAHLGADALHFLVGLQISKTAIELQPEIKVRDIGFRNEHGRADIDLRRPAVFRFNLEITRTE